MKFLSQNIFRFRRYLPSFLWQKLQKAYWKWFWGKEYQRLQKIHGPEVRELIDSERACLIEAICGEFPFENILEVGCAYGNNIGLLSEHFPDVHIHGIDIDRDCVSGAQHRFPAERFPNVTIEYAAAEDLSKFSNNSFDVSFTAAVLLYIGAEEIEQALSELIRISRRRLLLVELHSTTLSTNDQGRGIFIQRPMTVSGYWMRDYQALFKRLIPGVEPWITKVPRSLWASEPWDEFGHLIEVDLRDVRRTG